MPIRSPRTIAEATNDASKFDRTAENYDAETGTPTGVAKQGTLPNYAANPINPAEHPAPAAGLKR